MMRGRDRQEPRKLLHEPRYMIRIEGSDVTGKGTSIEAARADLAHNLGVPIPVPLDELFAYSREIIFKEVIIQYDEYGVPLNHA